MPTPSFFLQNSGFLQNAGSPAGPMVSTPSAIPTLPIRGRFGRGAGRVVAALGVLGAVVAAGAAWAAEPAIPRSPRPEKAQVYFISPENGARVASPVVVRFGLRDMGVAPAGVAQPQTGHHHLILDAEIPPAGLPIPKNDHYLHFGGGQTEVSLPLAPGKHTLQLLLGDHNHVPHDPPVVSERITIEVAK